MFNHALRFFSLIAAIILFTSVQCRSLQPLSMTECSHHSRSKHLNGTSECRSEERVDATKRELAISMIVSDSAGHIEEATAALTSMLYFRTCPLHVYMLTDDANMRLMMRRPPWNETSAYDSLKMSYIALPGHPDNVTFGVSNSFRAKHSILKAAMDRLMPCTVDYLVAADIDVLWVGDVCDILSEFDGWRDDEFVGVSPEESPHYIRPELVTGQVRAPYKFSLNNDHKYKINGADGLNGGIIYYKLAKARSVNWTGRWTDYIRNLEHPNPLPLGDQDVINRFGAAAPQYVNVLPNVWNHQIIMGSKCGARFWNGLRALHGNGGTLLIEPLAKKWWPFFADKSLAGHRGYTWPMHSTERRCTVRSILACLARKGAICDAKDADLFNIDVAF